MNSSLAISKDKQYKLSKLFTLLWIPRVRLQNWFSLDYQDWKFTSYSSNIEYCWEHWKPLTIQDEWTFTTYVSNVAIQWTWAKIAFIEEFASNIDLVILKLTKEFRNLIWID